MRKVKILLDSIEAVKNFITIISDYKCDMDLQYGSYIIDAKSIMGIFSLDLTKPVDFNINGREAEAREILGQLEPYIVQ